MDLKVIINRLYVVRTHKYEINDLLDIFNKSLQEAILKVIESGAGVRLGENLVMTTMRMRSVQFNNAIYNKRMADLDKVPDGGFAWCIVIQENDNTHHYVSLPTGLYSKMCERFGKVAYNDGYKDFSELKAMDFYGIVVRTMADLDKPKLSGVFDVTLKEFYELLYAYLCERLQNITFESDYGNIDVQPYAPPRGLSKYDYNKDMNQFEGFYYIPIEYTESLLLRKDWMLNGVLVTTNLKIAQRYSKYVLKAYSKTFMGNMFIADNFVINKYELLNFE